MQNQEKHLRIKRRLKIIGPCVLAVGAILAIVGFVSFFSSINSMEPPRFFFCAFIGLPLLFIGASVTMFGYKREMTSYVKNEAVPVFNEMGEEMSPGVSAFTRAVKDGLATEEEKILCSCGTENDKTNKFCKNCGKPLRPLCPECGKEVEQDSKFCPHCGKKL